MKKVLEFLTDLSQNNNKDWFHANRSRYEESRDTMLFVTEILINEVRKFDSEIPVMAPKDCMFRIFRDVRFSNDKRPYKTNFGGFIVPGGKNAGYAGYYVHIEPENCFLAGGIYMPPPDRLKAVRTEIYENTEDFKKIINDKNFKAHFKELSVEDKLKTAPKGFPKDFEDIDLLKYKHYTVLKPVSDNMVASEKFLNEIHVTFKALYPFNSFINEGINYQLDLLTN